MSVLVTGFPAGAFAANCYLVAPAPGEECVIIDPGQDAERGIEELLDRFNLQPIAVLLTHGHIDHMWCVAPVAGTYDATAYVHPADRHLLSNPLAGMSQEAAGMLLGGLPMLVGAPSSGWALGGRTAALTARARSCAAQSAFPAC